MSFISDIRAKRQVRTYSKENEDIFRDYLSKPLARDDLQNLVGMLSHPEIHQPLMKHMDDLLKQPNFDNRLKEQFTDRLQKLPHSAQRDAALDRLVPTVEATDALSDKLRTIKPANKKPSLQERLQQRIQDTYTAINAQVQRAQDRVNDVKDTAKNRLAEKRDNLVGKADKMKAIGHHHIDAHERFTNSTFKIRNTVMPAFDMLKERVTKKFNDFRDEYHSRKLTYQNDNNLRGALAKGLDTKTLADGIDSMQMPEIRYPMVHNADAILRQKAMTPKLADDFFNASLNYVASLDEKNPLREKFQQAFNDYDARAATKAKNVNMSNQSTNDKDAKVQKEAIDETAPSAKNGPSASNAKPETDADAQLRRQNEDREFIKQQKVADNFEKQSIGSIHEQQTDLQRELQLKSEDREFEKQQKVAQNFEAQRKRTTTAVEQKPDVKNAELAGFNEYGQAEYHFPSGDDESEQTIGEMMITEYPSDYIPPDDFPRQVNDEDYDVLNQMESSHAVPANAINDEAFTSGLENLEPPESSIQKS